MKFNLLFVFAIMSFAFGIYIGLCDSEVAFLFFALGIGLALSAIRVAQAGPKS